MPRPLPKSPMNAEPVDELPGDNDQELMVEYIKKAEFRASVIGARIDASGELVVNLKVPMEDKYLALPLTDIRAVLMVFSAYVPVQAQEQPNRSDLDSVWAGG